MSIQNGEDIMFRGLTFGNSHRGRIDKDVAVSATNCCFVPKYIYVVIQNQPSINF